MSEVKQWAYLRKVPFQLIDEPIDLLIGMNVPALLRPLEVVHGDPDEPYATRHLFGWAFNGPTGTAGKTVRCNRLTVHSSDLDKKVEEYISRDYVDNDNCKSLSYDDAKWMARVKSSITNLPEGGFQIALPFKDNVAFPDNRQQIYSRFLSLSKRLRADNQYFLDYDRFMQDMINEGYVSVVPEEELNIRSPNCWYLSHHGVYHKNKNKLRVVFNCSLKFNGVSLNDNLLQGPDLANSLFGVLLRFREESFAFTGDIQKMFYQVSTPAPDSNYMRFFWFDDFKANIREYRINVHVFGATSSPSVANYALKETAKDESSYEVRDTILHSFYVDDILKSLPTEDEAISLLHNVKSTLKKFKFNLTSFHSNSERVLESLASHDTSKGFSCKHLPIANIEDTRALGVTWKTKTDKISFNCNFLKSKASKSSVTKRELLQNLASVYDPLGLANPVIIEGKKLFQESCRLKCGWDDPLPTHLSLSWNKWLDGVRIIDAYEIPRCLKLPHEVEKVQLQIFCDGSETAYGCVAYTNFRYVDGTLSCSLVASKSRLTPLNNSTLKTVPRIELCGAKLAVELAVKLIKEFTYTFDNINYWCDSTTVLAYIKNDSTRFQRFVANKVAFIRNFSKPSQWYYVSSRENPADILSRGTTPMTLKQSDLWNHGPMYLRDSSFVPQQTFNDHLSADDSEVKIDPKILTSKLELTPIDVLMKSVSDYQKLKIRISYLVKFVHSCKSGETMSKVLSLRDLRNGERQIIKYLQGKYFSTEIAAIKLHKNLSKVSPLRKLSPFLDQTGIVRVGGRLSNSPYSYDVKHPVLLPLHYVTELLIKDIHSTVGHLGRETVLASLRKKYWVITGNSAVRKVIKDCLICRKLHAKPGQQYMSDLPPLRLQGDLCPFANTGVDYFGPFIVIHGRRSEKRWGVIFTCMVSRAIHLEIAYSLDTDAFLNCLRRFLCRRGNVSSITCDNGTNFVGGRKELTRAIKEWNNSAIGSSMKQRNIEFKFNPLSASHFGGAFEREFRSIRKVLNALLLEQPIKLRDDELNTLICEVEAVLNNRPLTEVNDDPNNIEALTPNHLLLHNAGVTFPPGLFEKSDCYVRRRWRQVQYLVNIFWTRWRTQYLVLLQERQKWQDVKKSFKVNDLVLVVDIALPRNLWPLGRIIEVFKDKRGHVRTVKVRISKCKDGVLSNFETLVLERPIVKLIHLCSLS